MSTRTPGGCDAGRLLIVALRLVAGWTVMITFHELGHLLGGWLSGDRHLDTARLLDAGAHPLAIGGYCIVTLGLGYGRLRADCAQLFQAPSPPGCDEV